MATKIPMNTEPLLITETMVTFFKFWSGGQLEEGLRCGSELFRHHQSFHRSQRQHVYALAWKLTECGSQVVITTSDYQYRVWTNLRTADPELVLYS